jgi:threonine aldolase
MARLDPAAPDAAHRPRIDLRSDVLSPPTPAMLDAMASAEIGWTLKSEDPSVRRLERLGATLLGAEAAVFVPNATTANLLALLVGAERGTAVLLDRIAHINVVEWYALSLGGLLARTVSSDRGHLDATEAEAALGDGAGGRAPRVSMLVLENTHTFAGGVPIPPDETGRLAGIAHAHGATVHLDGARLFDAAVALGVPPAALTAAVDTTTVSLSKGLCAPYGGLLAGRAPVIERARALAFQIGFGRIHKAGYLAAAGIVALESMIDRLADDHRRARRLGEGLARIDGLAVDLETVRTNIVLARLDERFGDPGIVEDRLRERGVGVMAMPGRHLRAVVHRGIDDDDIGSAIDIIAAVLG